MEAHRAAGMVVQERDLLRQLAGRGPVVVPVEERDVLSLRGPKSAGDDLVAAQIMLGKDKTDRLRKSLGILQDDIPGAIRRSIFADDDLVREVDLLSQSALQRLPNEPLVVVGHYESGDFHRHPARRRAAG